MRYNSWKGLMLQFLLIIGMFLIPAIIVNTLSQRSLLQEILWTGRRNYTPLYLVVTFPLYVLVPFIRGTVLKRKLIDYPRKGKVKGIILWVISYVCSFIVLAIIEGMYQGSTGNRGMFGVVVDEAALAPAALILAAVLVAIRDSFLARSRATSELKEDGRRKKKMKRLPRYYTREAQLRQLIFNAISICALIIIATVASAATIEWWPRLVDDVFLAIMLIFPACMWVVREVILRRSVSDYPKKGEMLRKLLVGFLWWAAFFVGTALFIIFMVDFGDFTDLATVDTLRRAPIWLPALVAAILAFTLAFAVVDFIVLKPTYKKKAFTCPYCFVKNLVWDALFRCTNSACADAPDYELTRYENGDLGNPIRSKGTFAKKQSRYSYQLIPKRCKCSACRSKTSQIICPACHNNLPQSTLYGEDMIFSIVGPHDSGKSHFLGVLIHELQKRVAGSFDSSLVNYGDSQARYENRFRRKMYDERSALDFTESFLTSKNGAFKPLIFELRSKRKKQTLVFYETAGVDLDDLDTMTTVNKFISKSAGIMFLVDPVQSADVVNRLGAEVFLHASGQKQRPFKSTTRPDDILGRISTLIRNDNNIKTNEKIDIPMAAVLSKFDIMGTVIPPGLTFSKPSPHCASKDFVISDWEKVSAETQVLLRNLGEESFMAQLDVNYDKQSYFVVSALGLQNRPYDGNLVSAPSPHRVEDPLLWLMKDNDII